MLSVGVYRPAQLYLKLLGLMTAALLTLLQAKLYMRPVQRYLYVLGHRQTYSFRSQNYDSTEIEINPRVVDEFEQLGKGSLLGETDPQNDNDNRCFNQSMGSPLQWQESSGSLVLTTGQEAYKGPGTLGSVEGSESFFSLSFVNKKY